MGEDDDKEDDEEKDDVETKDDEEKEEKDDKKPTKKTVYEWEQVNTQKAIWLCAKEDVTEEEYTEFYKSISKAEVTFIHLQLVTAWPDAPEWRACPDRRARPGPSIAQQP